MQYRVKFVDSAMVRHESELVSEYDMSDAGRFDDLAAAEAEREAIETEDPGSRAWVDRED